MNEQHGPVFPPTILRTNATQEDIDARRVMSEQARTGVGAYRTTTHDYPPASPHRVGHTPGIHGEDAPYLSQEVRPGRRQTIEDEAFDYPEDPPRRRTTVVVRKPAKPTRRLPRTR